MTVAVIASPSLRNMADLVRLKRSRATCRSWLQREVAKLQTLIEVKEPDVFAIDLALKELEKRLDSWDAAQAAVELEINEEDLQGDLASAGEFRDSCVAVRDRATKLRASGLSRHGDGGSQASQAAIKLPKLDLPRFGGNVQDWPEFWDSFVACVDKSDIDDIAKLAYLKSLLSGEARQSIEGLTLSSSNYSVACDLLKERFGRAERIVFTHVQSLLAFSSQDCSDLRKLQDGLLVHIRSLEGLGFGGDKYGLFLTPLILSKLPSAVRLEWARDGAGKEGDLVYLLKFLKEEVERRERSGALAGPGPGAVAVGPGPGAVAVGAGPGAAAVGPGPGAAAVGPSPGAVAVGAGPSAGAGAERSSGPAHRGRSQRRPRLREVKQPSAAALHAVADAGCGFCGGPHSAVRCPNIDWNSLPVSDRQNKIKAAGLCFTCLKKGHMARSCSVRCSVCNGRHNKLCCYKEHGIPGDKVENVGPSHGVRGTAAVGPSLSCVLGEKCTVLPTARVTVHGAKGPVEATVLFDSGSDRSYVSSALIAKSGAKWVSSQESAYVAFGGGHSRASHSDIYELRLTGAKQVNPAMQVINVMEVPMICAPLQRPRAAARVLSMFDNLELADDYHTERQVSVDILIGLDLFWTLMIPGRVQGADGLVAQLSVFGWVLSGLVEGSLGCAVGCQLLTLGDLHESTVRNLWSLEGIGVCSEESTESDVLSNFGSSVRMVDGRYEVKLPWKEDAASNLMDNRDSAEARLAGLSRKFAKNPHLEVRYNRALKDMEQAGVIAEVPPEEIDSPYPTFYLPHRPVVKESSSTTKVRPVFDASACGPNGVSLNDCLEVGPCLLPNLVEVLLRFRRWPVAVTADVTKAFLQIRLSREDQDAHRFLWSCEGRTRLMRAQRVIFGVCSSPYLLNATIQYHLSRYPDSPLMEEMRENFYVDDFLSGADSKEEASELLSDAQAVMAEASMVLAKCQSNCVIFDRAHVASDCGKEEGVKVLGVMWLPSEDVFTFQGVTLPRDIVPTKRVVLSVMARLFDPLGFLTPFVMTSKCLFQELWQLGLQWDDPLPSASSEAFCRWLNGLELLKDFRIPRCYSEATWRESRAAVELHSFSDASPKGYGAAVYIRVPLGEGSYAVSLVMAKGRVAPLKQISLPRLELLGCLIAARLLVFVRKALRLPDVTPCYCWSDAMIALAWIRASPRKWKQFVANRVTEIQSLTSPSSWSHVSSADNPADLTTRGLSAEELVGSSLWRSGPSWLSGPTGRPAQADGPDTADQEPPVEVAAALAACESDMTDAGSPDGVTAALSSSVSASQYLLDTKRWSSLSRAVRVLTWVRRFIHNARSARVARGRRTRQATAGCYRGELTSDEISEARRQLLVLTQREAYPAEVTALLSGRAVPKSSSLYRLNPFLSDDGFVRVQTRLQMADLSDDEIHPILLPNCHVTELLVREQHLLMRHAGVPTLISALRGSFWIIGVRRIAKRVKRQCILCQKQDARSCNTPVAPLPRARVTQSPPFAVTGLDFAGPVFCLDQPCKKLYICLFTCAVTRAVHLELMDSMSLSDFVLALRRFAARRGMPSEIFSDNAATLKGAAAYLQTQLGHLAPAWRFIAPQSPWWGGWWERLVRSVKSGLKKSLGKRCLTKTELETLLFEIESCVNSRPLVYSGDDSDSSSPLTPSHFLIGRSSGFQSKPVEQPAGVSPVSLSIRARRRRERLDRFWDVWSAEYLRQLPVSVRKFRQHGQLKVGSVTLIRDENVPRLMWPLAVVTKLYASPDGVVRTADLRTARGMRTRAVHRLHDLEVGMEG